MLEYSPEDVATVNVDVPDPPDVRATVEGLNVTVGPDGDTVSVRFTFPANPF